MDETRGVESMMSFTLEESMNTFIMQLNNALQDFDTFFRVHSTSSPFWPQQNTEVIELIMMTYKDP